MTFPDDEKPVTGPSENPADQPAAGSPNDAPDGSLPENEQTPSLPAAQDTEAEFDFFFMERRA